MLAQSEKDKILIKLQRYCDYQDRCHRDVRTKLLSLKVYHDDLEEIMAKLVSDNFLNEERFARSFARGRFRIKNWGKVRIERELRRREISPYCIRTAMKEIDEDEYVETLDSLANKNFQRYDALEPFKKRRKVFDRLLYKGYEIHLINKVLNRLFDS